MAMSEHPILMVGIVCLDIINHCDRYPMEDEDIRASNQTWNSGGNASNSSKVLSLVDRRCEFLGTLGGGMETKYVYARLFYNLKFNNNYNMSQPKPLA